MPKKTKTQLKKKLDVLWRTVGKENAVCEICATLPPNERINYTQLHCHHLIGRLSQATRYSLENRIILCSYHHSLGDFSAHNRPEWFRGWLKEHKPEQYEFMIEHQHDLKNWTTQELEEKIRNLSEPMLN